MAFAEPLAFLFAASYGVLVLFYLWERWRRQVVVPSLLLWERVREDTLRVRRFRPDLLFFVQLLILTCLIAGLARPYLREPVGTRLRGRHIFILDSTASMQTQEGPGTRFDESRAQALQQLRNLDPEQEVMVVSAGQAPEVLLNFTRDHDTVARTLAEATPTDTGGDLSLALAFVESARQRSDLPTEVDVFTDIPRSQLPPPLREAVTLFQVGESDDNLGIEALQIFQGRFQDYRRARAHVLVENFSHRERHGFLTVRLGEQTVSRIGFTIAARDSQGFLVRNFPGPGHVVAQLEVTDALAADNIAHGWIRSVRPVHALVVSPASPLIDDLRALAAVTPALQLTAITPEEFSVDRLKHADLVILHRFAPEPQPLMNALYIYPPSENHLFPVVGTAENVEVLDWNAHHVALQALRPLPSLPVQRARIVSPPAWSQVLLWSRTTEREFPLAFAGEVDGRRLACITFDLEAERLLGSDNINSFLFLLNVLGWLSPATDDDVQVVRVGEVQELRSFAAEPVRVTDPYANAYTLAAAEATLQPQFAGEYRISTGGRKRTLLANFFDRAESDIGRAGKEPPVQPVRPATHPPLRLPPAGPGGDYRAGLYAAAAALFVLEWAARRRVQ